MLRSFHRLFAAALLALVVSPAAAQVVTNHAIAVGRAPAIGLIGVSPGASGTVPISQGATSDPAFVTISGDCAVTLTGAMTCAKSNGVTVPSSGTSGGIPYYSSTSAISSSAALTANRIVLGGGAGTAPTVAGSLGTTTTLLHGNAAGAPTFGSVVSGDLNITGTTCTNQFVSAISSAAAGTCTTDTLAGAQHANQGTTTTVLHGNAVGNPSWGSVAISTDVSGLGTGIATALGVNTGSAGAPVLLNGAGGTPSSLTLTNATGLPISGLSGLGTGVGAALAVNTGSAGAPVLFNGAGGTPSSVTLTNGSGLPASGGLTGQVPIANGGTAQSTAAAARAASGLNVYARTAHGDSNYTILSTDRTVDTSATFTAPRTWTLPAANAVNPDDPIDVRDHFGGVGATNTLTIAAAGTDTINGAASLAINSQYGGIALKSDGVSSWHYVPSSAGGGSGTVSSVTISAGTGISTSGTCSITTSGTCTVGLTTPVGVANGGTGLTAASALASGFPVNAACAASVSGSALTVALKGNDGNDPSSSNPVYIPTRSATATTGTQDVLTVTAATSLTISSGSTMGFSNATAGRLWIVAFDDAGTERLGAVNALSGTNIMALRDNVLASSTAEGGSGAADSAQTIYTGTAVSSKGMRILCYMDWISGLTTAGTWASGPTLVQMFGPGVPKPGDVVQVQRVDSGTLATGTTVIPRDSTIPQSNEGNQYLSQAIAPTSAANLLVVDVHAIVSTSGDTMTILSLFRDSGANALTVTSSRGQTGGSMGSSLNYRTLANSTSSTTFALRAGGPSSGTTSFNGESGSGFFGGTYNSYLQVQEVMG